MYSLGIEPNLDPPEYPEIPELGDVGKCPFCGKYPEFDWEWNEYSGGCTNKKCFMSDAPRINTEEWNERN